LTCRSNSAQSLEKTELQQQQQARAESGRRERSRERDRRRSAFDEPRRESSHRRESDDSPLHERGRNRGDEATKAKERARDTGLDAELEAELESVAVSPVEKRKRAVDGDLAQRVKERLRQSLEKKRQEAQRQTAADVSAAPNQEDVRSSPAGPEARASTAVTPSEKPWPPAEALSGLRGPEALTPAGALPGIQGPSAQQPPGAGALAQSGGGVQGGIRTGDGFRGPVQWEGPLCKSGAPYCRVAMFAENVAGCKYDGPLHEPAG
jgi:hypothetical protein